MKRINNEDVKICALRCSTRTEFRLKYPGAYLRARKQNILNDVCKHMITKSYSTPQLILNYILETLFKTKSLYNDRKLIKPYEIDILFKDLNIGFEYDGMRWHRDDKIDKIKICKKHNITLLKIIQNVKNIKNAYELDIKKQLCKKLKIINKVTNKNITKNDINNVIVDYVNLVPNLQHAKNLCLQYTHYKDFKDNNTSLYLLLLRNNVIDECTSHMIKLRTDYTKVDINNIISKYTKLNEFIKNNDKLYQHLSKNNMLHLLNNLERESTVWTKETIKYEINKYDNLSDFKKNTGGCYAAAIKFGMHDELNKLDKLRTTYTIDIVKDIINKYTVLKDFINNDYNAYNFCFLNGHRDLYKHLEQREKWSIEKLQSIVNSCKNIKELSLNYKNAYSAIRKRHKYMLIPLKNNKK